MANQLEAWPHRLGLLLDPFLEHDQRMQVAQQFVDSPLCCLDELTSRRLREIMKAFSDKSAGFLT